MAGAVGGRRLLDRLAAEYEASLRQLRQPGEIAGGLEGMLDKQAALPLESRLMQASMMGVPVASDVAGLLADAVTYGKEPAARTPLNYGLSALGLLPFIPGVTVYHGTGGDVFGELSAEKAKRGGRGAVHAAESPQLASFYAGQHKRNQRVIPLTLKDNLKLADQREYDDAAMYIMGLIDDGKLPEYHGASEQFATMVNDELRRRGFDGVRYRHPPIMLPDADGRLRLMDESLTSYAVFDPRNLSSVFDGP